MAIKQYQYDIFSWSMKIWVAIFVHPKAVTNLKNGLYSPLFTVLNSNYFSSIQIYFKPI